MHLVTSIVSKEVNHLHFFNMSGLFPQNDVAFLFDTGAARSIIDLQSVQRFIIKKSTVYNQINFVKLKDIIRDEIEKQGIIPWEDGLRAANCSLITSYPCVCQGISFKNSGKFDFYFDFTFDEMVVPLLGNSFLDDSTYTHKAGGTLEITTISDNPGRQCYQDCRTLNFNEVVRKFNAQIGDGIKSINAFN